MELEFSKISGAGNDFIVFDNREKILSAEKHRAWFREICQRRRSVGADGIILLQKSEVADLKYVHINADGSYASMCGNGSRALALFAFTKKLAAPSFRFEISGEIYRATIHDDLVTTEFVPPGTPKFDLGVVSETDFQEGGLIYTGVPHFVIFVQDVARLDVKSLGEKYRHHAHFAPEGTNVNFAEVIDTHTLRVRTFERGVENETLACGTGSAASAIIASIKKNCRAPIRVIQPGGELRIEFEKDFSSLKLTGKARIIYEGRITLHADYAS